jgi:hypothetical protein
VVCDVGKTGDAHPGTTTQRTTPVANGLVLFTLTNGLVLFTLIDSDGDGITDMDEVFSFGSNRLSEDITGGAGWR